MTEHDFGFQTDFYTFSPETLAQELQDYRIHREVGKGSMGIVYEAERKSDGHRVALKVLPPSLTLTDRALARFVKEGEVMSRIDHPNIVRVLEHGKKGRLHFFAMQFVDGITLEERVRIGPLPARDAAELCIQIGTALQFAHDRGVIHRDVKPGNIILSDDGRISITDFGLARETGTGSFTESGAIVGTPMYMAPEQILGHRSDVDSRADVYGLGATLFELLTGHPPFLAPTAQGVLKAVLETDAPRPARLRQDLPLDLEAITLRALEKSPARRYGSAQEMADDLKRFLAGERVLARVPSVPGRLLRSARRHPLLSTLVAVIILLAGGAFWLYVDGQQQRIQEQIDQAELQLTKATARPSRGLRPPEPADVRMYLNAAKRLATTVLGEDEANLRAWLIRARVHIELDEWQEALFDLDRAAELSNVPREDVLTYRIQVLDNLNDSRLRQRLMADLKSLLELDQSPNTICIVADFMLRFAAELPKVGDREEILNRVDEMLNGIRVPSGASAIARAQVLQLRGRNEAATEAADKACIDYSWDPFVREQAARIYAEAGDDEAARAEYSMARLLRGEEQKESGAPPPRREVKGDLDVEAFGAWLTDLGRLIGERDGKNR